MISKEDKKYIELARKYRLRLGTMKCEVFLLFDEGYSPAEVRYALRNLEDPYHPRSFSNTVRRYYSLWKKAQPQKTSRK